ncbi:MULTISPECIES: DUF1700 domain-containing protein [unclassified Streptococcus]|uniref:DUF1700 domain-containing protein n=1 Tax=unclassified Streptococcus TaxID=2608887 RepID=UPI00359E3411
MTRTEYLKQLDSHLRKLPQADYEEAMAYFTEYFAEAGEENEALVMAELGTPKEAARDLINNILDKKVMEDRYPPRTKRQMIWLIILAIFAVPVGIPVILIILALLAALVVLFFSLMVAGASFCLALFIGAGIFLWDALAYLGQGQLFAFGFGGGLAMLGSALLLALLVYVFGKWTAHGLKTLVKWIIKKGQRA